jgi:diguanylate cyclase (GGDEF)-like protein
MDIVMIAWLKGFLLLERNIESHHYRREVTGRFIVLLSFIILFTLMIGNFIANNMPVFYVNFVMLSILTSVCLLPIRLRKYNAHFILHFMAVGVLLVVYFNQGQEYTPIWSFLYMFLVMSLHGYEQGLKISAIFLVILFTLLFSYTNSTVTMVEFIRFVMVSAFTLLFTYLAEMLISRSFEKFIITKTKLEELTKTDALTGLYNRRHFDDILPQQINIAQRGDELLTLLIIDIDHFKKHNDSYGHPAGDVALIALADLLSEKMKRANDTVFRIGGEEFALIYQSKSVKNSWQLAEEIRLAVAKLHVNSNMVDKITVSAGLLVMDAKQKVSANQAYEIADELLYQAKDSGRNKVVMSVEKAVNSLLTTIR